jgi:phage terminase large subunit-like protein
MQELEGELLDDVANALWTRELLDEIGCPPVGAPGGPEYLRSPYLGVDPSDGSEDSDEQAYTLAGLGPNDGHVYVAENWGGQEAPAPFARRCIAVALKWKATIVVEKNHGGAWLREVFKQAQKDMGTAVPVLEIHASQAKRTRAEPVSILYERLAPDGRRIVLHCRNERVSKCDCADKIHPDGHHAPDEHMPELEDQMATFTGAQGERSPDRLDSMVWAMSRYLRHGLGPNVAAAPRKWKAQQEGAESSILDVDLPSSDDLLLDRDRQPGHKRLAGAHGGLLTKPDWDLDSFAPQDEDDEKRDGARGKPAVAHAWR